VLTVRLLDSAGEAGPQRQILVRILAPPGGATR
jgi:hypothetical protein